MLFALLTACDSGSAKEDMVPVSLTGIDHLADHLSVQDFGVNGTGGFQAGKGGRIVCCVSLPRKWRPDLSVVVRWHITNWQGCDWESYERRVPVDRYDKVGSLYIHFMADGSVRAVSSNINPAYANPDYPGPHDRIPQKKPWAVYEPQPGRCPPQDSPTVMERAK
ncbi:hypothetical protein KYC_20794 [Achromobacter arsenitoxydans SY8]|uniref:Lipoprotein n=1 Tax=Achromobacter arsenitoxydans SY8 TaxID=477184 RepID=H0FBK2_9BURK|nr:hypothetical protein KYC_20794 [Achromobacter arsenitoxydans SY8]